jgi:Do/DeqQ family serine protease
MRVQSPSPTLSNYRQPDGIYKITYPDNWRAYPDNNNGSALTVRGWTPFGGKGQVPIYLAADPGVGGQVDLNIGFSAVAKAATPAVVTIETSARVRPQQVPFFLDPFSELFGLPDQYDRQSPRRRAPTPNSPQGPGLLQPVGLGSGVLISPDGYILTNNHVVDGADKIQVSLSDLRSFTAKLIGADPPSDIAVLKIDGNNLPTLPLGDSNRVQVGDVVLAIGNPLAIGQTVTMGIISAKGRSTDTAGSGSYEDFLQTDAAINRGNSGGALVNMRGELIGIPSQILSQSGGNIGIGFAIPTAMARTVMDQLIRGGKVHRGKLGVTIGTLNPALAEQFGYKGTKGALVQDVEPGQAADRAGVKPGDIVTEFQGRQIESSAQLRNLVAQNAPGSSVKFKVWRDGSERELTATLSEITSNRTASGGGNEGSGEAGGALSGMGVENLTPDLARRLNLPPTTHGVVVTNLDDDSNAAAAAGVQRGDLIEEVNHQRVSSVSEFRAALQKAGKNSVLLRVRRAQQGAFYLVVPGQQ